jgi:YVTN family beta-propeller protein
MMPARRFTLVPVLLLLALLIALSRGGDAPSVSAQTNATPTPLPLFALPDARIHRAVSSGSMALGEDGRTMVAANMINDSATLFIPAFDQVIAEIAVGRDPRGAAFTADGTRALITNRLDGTLSVIDVRARAVTATIPLGGVWAYHVIAAGNDTAYVSLTGSAAIAVVDLAAGQVRATIPVSAAPAGLALWGDFLYVTHYWSGQITQIYLPRLIALPPVSTGQDTAASQAMEIDITRGIAYLPQTRLNADAPNLNFDTAALPIVNVVSLRDLTLTPRARLTLDTADQPVNMPFALALDRFAQRLYVANAGSNTVSVIDLNTGRARASIPVGSNPRALLLNRDNTLLYVHNALDGTVTTIDTRALRRVGVLPIIDLRLSLDQLLGAQLFHTAADPRLSADGWLSCATCHFDGMSDGRTWRGLPGGARNTPLLYNLPETVPYTWSGTWDELADVEIKIRDWQAGTGLIEPGDGFAYTGSPADTHSGIALDLDLLTAYLARIQPPPRFPQADALARQRAAGREIFLAQGCASCHVGPAGTDLQPYEVGTGGMFDTPSLRWLNLSAPYLHDGRAATLYELFALPGAHQLVTTLHPDDLDRLVAYLLYFADP